MDMEIEGISTNVLKMKTEEIDRISELPQPLLHNIMSFLPFEHVVQTSILSKTWLRAWHSIPDLKVVRKQDLRKSAEFLKIEKRLNSVEQTLRNRHREMIILKKLILPRPYQEESICVDRCLCYAVESGVEKLHLLPIYRSELPSFFSYLSAWRYDLPRMVLCSKSINTLILHNCKLVLPGTEVILPCLRKLCLTNVDVDNDVIKNVGVHCVMLEYLNLEFCEGFKSLELFGFDKLHEIKLKYNKELERVKIEAVNVHSIEIWGQVEIILVSCMNLKRLTLGMTLITDKWLCYNIPKLPQLEYFCAFACRKLRTIKIFSHSLKMLDLCRYDYDMVGDEMLVEVKIKAPNLRILKYSGELVSFSCDASNALESHLHLSRCNKMAVGWYHKLVEVIAQFYQFSKVLNLASDCSSTFVIPLEFRRILPPPLFGAKHVSLSLNYEGFLTKSIVDDMLWIAPHTETMSIKSSLFTICFKFHYSKNLICGGESFHCWKSHPISCWWECMKEVEIEIDKTKLQKGDVAERYTFKGEVIWDSINGLIGSVSDNLADIFLFLDTL